MYMYTVKIPIRIQSTSTQQHRREGLGLELHPFRHYSTFVTHVRRESNYS